MANKDLFAPPSKEELIKINKDLLAPPSREELAGPSFGQKVVGGIVDLGEKVDSVTGAPTRAGLMAATQGRFKDIGSDFVRHFAEDPAQSPTGRDIARQVGISDDAPVRTPEEQKQYEEFVRIHQPGYYAALQKAGVKPANERISPAQVAGFGIDLAADPTNLLSLMPMTKIMKQTGKLVSASGEAAPKIAGKAARFFSGVDDEAAARQVLRPRSLKAAEADDFGYNVGKKAINEIQREGEALGEAVHGAKRELLKNKGKQAIDTRTVRNEASVALEAAHPSPQGFSGMTEKQRQKLSEYLNKLDQATVEDLVKVRNELDMHLRGKYGQDVNDYNSALKTIRHESDVILDNLDVNFNKANTDFANFAENKRILGIGDERTAESIVNNIYGKNKVVQQKAAKELLGKNTMAQIKDIAANKAFENARGPAGSEFGARRILGIAGAIPTGGLSIVVTSPDAWKHGLRGLGKVGQKLGKYGPILEQAAKKSPEALIAVDQALRQASSEYRRIIEDESAEKSSTSGLLDAPKGLLKKKSSARLLGPPKKEDDERKKKKGLLSGSGS